MQAYTSSERSSYSKSFLLLKSFILSLRFLYLRKALTSAVTLSIVKENADVKTDIIIVNFL